MLFSGAYVLWNDPLIVSCMGDKQASAALRIPRAADVIVHPEWLLTPACEGAMLASVEYMLCGLPLVTTPCRGGREQFFDDRYVKVVDPTAPAVAQGVRDLIESRINPELVRAETLKKLQVQSQPCCSLA
jgi:glycosyltransferase involved in cell wall biosynthesis